MLPGCSNTCYLCSRHNETRSAARSSPFSDATRRRAVLVCCTKGWPGLCSGIAGFIPFDDIGSLYGLVLFGAIINFFHARKILSMQHAKMNGLRPCGRKHFDGEGNQSETDVAFPNDGSHVALFLFNFNGGLFSRFSHGSLFAASSTFPPADLAIPAISFLDNTERGLVVAMSSSDA